MKDTEHPRETRSSGGDVTSIKELLTPSGKFKAQIAKGRDGVLRVYAFRWVEDEPTNPYWEQVDGPEFVDSFQTAGKIATGLLRSASGEQIESNSAEL